MNNSNTSSLSSFLSNQYDKKSSFLTASWPSITFNNGHSYSPFVNAEEQNKSKTDFVISKKIYQLMKLDDLQKESSNSIPLTLENLESHYDIPGADEETIQKRKEKKEHICSIFEKFYLSIKFTIEKKLGEGNFGEVYKGRILYPVTGIPTTIACKKIKNIISDESTILEENITKLMKEAIIHQSIAPHPNIVQMIGTGPKMLILEYCAQGDLSKRIESIKLLPIIKGIAKGLAHLHRQGIIHNDIAARNILIDCKNIPKISDFGSAKQLKKDQQGHFVPKKVRNLAFPVKWTAPEVWQNQIISSKSDIWMFGITCLELISKEEPMPKINNFCYEQQLLTKDITSLSTWMQSVFNKNTTPLEIQTIIKNCLEINPEQRPDIEAVLASLNHLSSHPFVHLFKILFSKLQKIRNIFYLKYR